MRDACGTQCSVTVTVSGSKEEKKEITTNARGARASGEPETEETEGTTGAETTDEGETAAERRRKAMSEGQFLYLADQVRKFRDTHPNIGPGEEDFDLRFRDRFGFPWDFWTRQVEQFDTGPPH
jgi:hypothetical protein